MLFPGTLVCWVLSTSMAMAAAPLMRLAGVAEEGTPLLQNGDFENVSAGIFSNWNAASEGFVAAAGEGQGGGWAVRCASQGDKGWYGVSQTVVLDRSTTRPLVVRGWSKAAGVGGSRDNDYSLYLDLLYADGTPWWGQTATFHTGTHDWERRELVLLPEKPLKSLTVHCLFRNHPGQVWFDNVSVTELRAEGGRALFQGVPVLLEPAAKPTISAASKEKPAVVATGDGLSLGVRDNVVVSLEIGGKELAAAGPSGFMARDVGANSGFYGFQKGECAELGLELDARFEARPGHIVVQGRLADARRKDRAVTLVFALPLNATGWRWGDDIRRGRVIQGQGEFSKLVNVKCGSTGAMSLYPLAELSNQSEGLALAIDMAKPAVYRLGYHAGTQQLFIAYDLGLVPDTAGFPSAADFSFVLYRFEPRWGFRAAFQKLTEIFPDYFLVRSHEQGLWMPFTDISKVERWADFGFRYHEGNNNVSWDDQHGVLSFRYTEPMTWWMRMPPEAPRTVSEAVRWRDEFARGPREPEGEMARVSKTASMWDEAGEPFLLFRNEPWCNGAVWSLNPNPRLGTSGEPAGTENRGTAERGHNAATVHWNAAIREALYGAGARGRLDGEYLDSLEGYVTADLNFRREHFRYSTVPLTFERESARPALFKGLAVFEFTHWFAGEVHGQGKLTFANGVPYRFSFLCPWLDVLGTETDWLRAGKYQPVSDEQMGLWRTMAAAKPYLLLMNSDFDRFGPEMMERYFQRSLFYGMFPGMFSHNAADNPYWENPKWYNRDRALFKKYIPLVKRVAEAGWQPVTHVESENPQVFVERFGSSRAGGVFFTLFNDTTVAQRTKLHVDVIALGLSGVRTARELISGNPLPSEIDMELELQPQQVKVIEVSVAR